MAVGTDYTTTFDPCRWKNKSAIIELASLLDEKMFLADSIHRSALRWIKFLPSLRLPDLRDGSVSLFRIELKVFNNLRV